MAPERSRTDMYGLPLSCGSEQAAELYRAGQHCMLAQGVEPAEILEQAIAANPDFPLAYAALALVRAREMRMPEARGHADTACTLASMATERERGHVQAVSDAVGGRGAAAIERVQHHLKLWPRDALLLSNTASALLFSGRQDEMVELTSGVASAYGDDWYFLGQHAFALEESGRFEEARAAAERSLQLYARAAFTVHALVHVFYETGDNGQGMAFMPGWMAGYDRRAGLHLHLSWHEALFLLASSEYTALMELYDHDIRPAAQPGSFMLYDPISLLWRLDLNGDDTGERWAEVEPLAAQRAAQPGVIFGDLHHGMALAATGQSHDVDRLCDSLRAREKSGNAVAGEVALPLLLGMAAFAGGDYEETVRLIAPIEDRIFLVGGSKAQREVFHDTLLEALLRSERFEQAEATLRERLDRRPSPRDFARLDRAHTALNEQTSEPIPARSFAGRHPSSA